MPVLKGLAAGCRRGDRAAQEEGLRTGITGRKLSVPVGVSHLNEVNRTDEEVPMMPLSISITTSPILQP
jgi:hypothetical protein